MKIIRPLRERVLAELKGLGGRYTAGGLFIPDENRKDSGIRARWARVYYVGEGQTDVKVGDYVLMAHGRWSREFEVEHEGQQIKMVMLDTKEMLAVYDGDEPDEF